METIEQMKEKINYCLNCKHKPCQKACPMQTNIPLFIENLKENKIKDAYKILLDNNIFSPICSSICPQENQCEGSCTRGIKGKPVDIGKLEFWVNEYAKQNSMEYNIKANEKNNYLVAVIGSGPASLSCAYELAKQGVQVTIFEKEEKLGGILQYGIPPYRLNKEDLNSTINKILGLGIKVQNNCEFGKDINIESLKSQGFDAIFIGIGAGTPSIYSLDDEKLDGIYASDYFLKEYNEGRKLENLGKTVVIGGGNVAMDCARTASRLGADVSILYRRGIENMPARKIEIQEAKEDGVEIIPCTKVISAKGENGHIAEVECIKTEVLEGKAVDIQNSNYTMKIDTFIFAIGLSPEKQLLEQEGIEMQKGLITVDEKGKTNLDKVYAGGDVTENKSTVCRAISAGKRAAKGILEELNTHNKNK